MNSNEKRMDDICSKISAIQKRVDSINASLPILTNEQAKELTSIKNEV